MSGDVAVLLNAQARGVTPGVVDRIAQQLPRESVFVSSSLDEAQELTHEILARGFQTVVTGGGDGTLVSFLNHSFSYLESSGEPRSYPLIGVLKLGTGNGIGTYVGADDYIPDLRRMMFEGLRGRQRLSLIEVEGTYCYFSGFGLDAAILNDYHSIKDTWLGRRLKYALSVPALSVPKQLTLRRRFPVGRIVNEGSPAYLIGDEGQPVGRPIERGETIYHGPIQIAGISTTPYYGYEMKLYPFVERRPGRMQLRVAWASTFESLANLPALWDGTYRSKNIRDYWCDSVRISFGQEVPFQIGGDGAGTRSEAVFTLSRRTVDLIDLSRPIGGLLH